MQSVITASEQGAVAAVVIALAAVAPPLAPPFIAAYDVYAYAHEAWHWHPMFSIMLALAALSILGAVLVLLAYFLPRILSAGLLAAYFATVYFVACHAGLGLDEVWSGGAATLTAIAGASIAWHVSGEMKDARRAA
jgi:MFS family permease